MRLQRHEAILDRDATRSDSVRVMFSSSTWGTAEVSLPTQRWFDMGQPSRIKVTVELACTCGPGREHVAHHMNTEPHFAGCPRWGTPLAG